jgi:ribonuclease HI
MSQPNGNDIYPTMLQGEHEPTTSNVRFMKGWPRQDKPSASQRRLWKRYIQANYLRYGTKWRRPLGEVLQPYQRKQYHPPNQVSVIPTLSKAAMDHAPESLKQFILRLPTWHKRMISEFQQLATDLQVWRAFRSHGRLIIASDGGLKARVATFGWTIVGTRGGTTAADIPLFEGSGPVDGPYDITNSTRSELGGLVAPLLFCASLAAYWGLRHKCKLRWLTDSKAAISKVEFITRRSHKISKAPEDHDYMTAIRELTISLSRRIQTQWIKGHQDDRTPYGQLPRAAQLNVDADNLATRHQNGSKCRPKESIPHLQEQKVSVVINGRRYPGQVDAQIRYHINGSNLKHYLTTKRGWTEATWNKIDMHNFGTHFRRLPMVQKVQHMKYVHNLQSVGQRKGRISNTDDGPVTMCPCCQTACETQFHLIHCRSNPARQESLTEFHKEVRRSQGKNFGRIISDVFEQWFEDPYVDPSLTNTRDPTLDYEGFSPDFVQYVKTAISHQNEIGWMNATQGFLAKSWYQVACTQIQIPGPNGIIHSSRDDGHSRTYKVVCALHTLVTSLWKGRNDVLHRQDHEKGVLLRTVVDADIARLHSTPSSLPVADQHYCHHSLAYILGKSPAYKRRWLYRVRAAAERYKQDQCQQHRITDFYYREPHQRQKQSTLTEYDNPVSPTTAPKHHRRLIRTTQRTLTEFFANAPLI